MRRCKYKKERMRKSVRRTKERKNGWSRNLGKFKFRGGGKKKKCEIHFKIEKRKEGRWEKI